MTIAYAALHRTLSYRNDDTGLYAAAFIDGTMFFSRQRPSLYDRQARPIPVREVLPDSVVKIKYRVQKGINWMEAIQLVQEPPQESPFDPILGDGHL
jgi:hypothetical protein